MFQREKQDMMIQSNNHQKFEYGANDGHDNLNSVIVVEGRSRYAKETFDETDYEGNYQDDENSLLGVVVSNALVHQHANHVESQHYLCYQIFTSIN